MDVNFSLASIIDFEKLTEVLGPLMLLILGVLFVIAILGTVVLNYHWKKYGVREASIKRVRGIYLSISCALFLVMAASVAVYYVL